MNMRELRNTRQLKLWLKAGKVVELRDRDRVVGRIVPPDSSPTVKVWPDFEARARKILGDQVLPGADLVIEERGRY